MKRSEIRAEPLKFIEDAPNPLAGMPEAKTEEELTDVQKALRAGFIARSKAEKFRRDETTRTDFFFCVVFEHGDQAKAFMKHWGYPDPDAQFVDGTILAKAMGIELPPTPFRLKPLRPADKSLQHLVTAVPSRSEIKKAPE